MDSKKKAAFVKAMGKKRASFAKGGLIRRVAGRKYFADGGTTLGGPNGSGVNPTSSNPNTGIVGTVQGALGLNNNFKAGTADLQQGTNAAQLNAAYTGAQGALTNQGNLVTALNPQVSTAVGNQNALAQQLYGMTQGQGPNPAQMELNQATGNNISQQAALMAGQRGASANVGLMAREAAMQGANTQQQAAGQAATLQAQQQIAAQQNLANLANTQVNQAGQATTAQNTAQQNEQSILQGANNAYNSANVAMQSNLNNVNSQTAAGNQNMLPNVMGALGSAGKGVAGIASMFSDGGAVEKEHHVKLAEMNAASLSHGKPHFANGGPIGPNPLLGNQPNGSPSNWGGQYASAMPAAETQIQPTATNPEVHLQSGNNSPSEGPKETFTDGETKPWDIGGGMAGADDINGAQYAAKGGMMGEPMDGPHESHVANFLFSKGGEVPAMVSPGEVYLSPEAVHKVVNEGKNPMKIGQRIGGKAKVRGDSLKNDTVKMTLQEGGVVIPRHIATHKMSAEKAELFVHRAIARKKAARK